MIIAVALFEIHAFRAHGHDCGELVVVIIGVFDDDLSLLSAQALVEVQANGRVSSDRMLFGEQLFPGLAECTKAEDFSFPCAFMTSTLLSHPEQS